MLRKVGRKSGVGMVTCQPLSCLAKCFSVSHLAFFWKAGRLNPHLFLMAVVVVIAMLGELQRYTAMECLNCLKVKNVTGYSCNSRNLIAAVKK